MENRWLYILGGACLILIIYGAWSGDSLKNELESVVEEEELEMDLDSLKAQEAVEVETEAVELFAEPVETSSETVTAAPAYYQAPTIVSNPAEPVSETPTVEVVSVVDNDGDGVDDGMDNCLGRYNPTQADTDHDGFGNECDTTPYGRGTLDSDGDGVTDPDDSCPTEPNPDQIEIC